MRKMQSENLGQLKYRYNIVSIITAMGGIIALIGLIVAASEFPGHIGLLDYAVFILALLSILVNIKPNTNKTTALMIVIIGLLMIINSTFIYLNIGNAASAESFTDVGYGVWIMITGSIIYTIFALSDYSYKRKG